MAEKLCTLRTKGGGGATQTETVLWTNSSPSSSFAAQNVTLSDSLSNYDYIKVTYRISTSDGTSTSAICSVSDFKNYNTGTNKGFWLSLGGNPINSQSWVRELTYVSDTSIGITGGLRIQANSNDTSYLIPTSIIGIKNMGGKEQGSDWATISVATTGTSNICTGYAVASNSNKFTASYTNGSASGTITVLEEGLYDYISTSANRGTGTATVKIGNQSYTTGKGEVYISANTVCTVSVGGTAGSLGLACITLVKKS